MNVLLFRIVLLSLGTEAVLGVGNDAETLTYFIRNNNVPRENARKTGAGSGEVTRPWYPAYRTVIAGAAHARGRGTAASFWLAIRTLVNSINATSLRLKTMETRMMSRFGHDQDGSTNRTESEMVNFPSANQCQTSCKPGEEKADSAVPASLVTAGGRNDSTKPSSLGRFGRRDRNYRLKRSAAREASEQPHGLGGPFLAPGEATPAPLALNQSTDFPIDTTTIYELFTFPDDDRWETTTDIPPVNTPENTDNTEKPKNPFYPVTRESYGAYAVACISIVIFTVGVVGNIATMCVVCHNYNMRSMSNWLLANLALWDLLLLLLCLPLVLYQELTQHWPLGTLSCKALSYLQVVCLGVCTLTLCALCVDRFRSAPGAHTRYESLESCGSTAAKLAVIWLGALLLAGPELLVHGLEAEGGAWAGPARRSCAVRVSPELPDALYAFGLTYAAARLWWLFGCYFCLPTLFAACGALAAGRRVRRAEKACARRGVARLRAERQLSRALVALAVLYGLCVAPETSRIAVSAHMEALVPRRAARLLWLSAQLLLIARAAATPVLLFCLCPPYGHALRDCCCCRRRGSASQRHRQDSDREGPAQLELSLTRPAQPQTHPNSTAATGTHC